LIRARRERFPRIELQVEVTDDGFVGDADAPEESVKAGDEVLRVGRFQIVVDEDDEGKRMSVGIEI
jgi:hypothetical protein